MKLWQGILLSLGIIALVLWLAWAATPLITMTLLLLFLVLGIGMPILISKRAKKKASESGEKEEVESTMRGWGFWTALATTAGPIVILSVYSAVRAAAISKGPIYAQYPFHMVWYIAAALWVIACVAEIVSRGRVRSQIVKGIVVGIWVGTVSLLVTCGVNLSTTGAE